MATAVAYVAAYAPLSHALGTAAGILAVVPVVATAWVFGQRVGLIAGLMGFPVNSLLVVLLTDVEWLEWAAEGGALGTGALALIGGVIGRLRDLTLTTNRALSDRIRAEEEIRRLALAVETTSEAVMIFGMEGQITFVNRAAEEMAGYMPGEMLGMSIFNLLPASLRDTGTLRLLEDTIAEGVWTGDVLHQKKTGEEFPVRLSTALMTDDEGRPVGMVAISTDMTERRLLEEQLLQSQKMEAVGQLAGGVAHDFNNLLTAIMGYAELGMRRVDAEQDHLSTSFREIQKAAGRAADLTQKLLAFSRHAVTEPTVLSLSELILDMDLMLRRLIGEGFELVTMPGTNLWMVRADPGGMGQCLTNLVVNARDAMPECGTVTIETSNATLDQGYARSHSGVTPGEYVLLTVRDTGIGMTEEVKAHVFEPLFTTKELGSGTGLGLSTCYGIVTQSGGHITVESEPGQGATFRIYLPRAIQVTSPTPHAEPPGEPGFGSETVLLVEDQTLVRHMVSQVLSEQGYNVLEALNGVEALRMAEMLADEEIHLLLSDIVMPLMSGRELVRRIKELHPEARVLLTSGYTGDTLVRGYASEPSADFLQKPFTAVLLARKVREVLDR